jgi:hypothetical protein
MNLQFQLGDQVVFTLDGKKIKGEYLDGNKKKSNIITANGDEITVSTKKVKLLF